MTPYVIDSLSNSLVSNHFFLFCVFPSDAFTLPFNEPEGVDCNDQVVCCDDCLGCIAAHLGQVTHEAERIPVPREAKPEQAPN